MLAAWGSVVLVGAVLRHRLRHGPDPREILRDEPTRAPLVWGTLALLIGGGLALVGEAPTVTGWLCLALAVPVMTVALLLSAGSVGGLAELLISAGLLLVAPWSPLEHPWSIVPWAAGLLAVAWWLRPREPAGPLARWDLSTFVVAHAVAAIALFASTVHGSVPVTFVAVAVLSGFTGLAIGRREWIFAGAVLALFGAASAGPGWLALALGGEGVASTIRGLKLEGGPSRSRLLVLGSAMVTLAGVAVTDWQAWSALMVMQSIGLGAAMFTVPLAWVTRRGRGPRDLWLVWLADAATTAMVACGLAFLPEIGQRAGGLTAAGVLAMLAVSGGVSACAVHPVLRWIAAALAGGSWTAAYIGLEPGPVAVVAVGTTIALVVGLELLLVDAASPTSPWIGPAFALCAFAQLGSLLVAVNELPRRGLLIAVLLALAAESAVGGVVFRAMPFVAAAPALACLAWLVYAGESLASPRWFTVPIGLTMLVDVGLIRWLRRGRGEDVVRLDLVVLEFVGMFFLVAASLAEVLSGNLWYSLSAIGIGIVLGAWGILTRVRRRAVFGAAVIVLSAVLVVAVPLARAVPTWTGPALWLAVAALGVAAILFATLLEQSRSAIRHAATRLDEMTSGWE